jgi:XTP/dITP diphosphohydrolase
MHEAAVPVVLATTNRGKVEEFRRILAGLPGPVLAADEAGLILDVDETGTTFEANARLKAEAYHTAARAAGLRC